ncbi:MAG: transcriptional regulator [Candidatus Eremiobacter antarcticus]|nr:winged helix-turn-helix transcriptional regulator [Candidatus Eremiobacteraeota bacterium]MBC5808850.1 winged helix-turn-helix transcriptional regulator [Candidatus Eremiobacteraeota bacterium]PZR60463.1 MAG: transcriptional regulator [Candidatus Eremiobacter sp. RRmetagenome_bin22]
MQGKCSPKVYRLQKELADEAELLKAVADIHRMRILATLARAEGDVCVCDLNASLPLLQPTVSHHLKILKDAGLVTSERRGTWVYHRLKADARSRLESILDLILPQRIMA